MKAQHQIAYFARALEDLQPDLTDEEIAAECARIFTPDPASKSWVVGVKAVLSLPFLLLGVVAGFIVHAFLAGYIFGESAINKLADETSKK